VGEIAPREASNSTPGAVDENRPADVVAEPKPVDVSGIRYSPRPEDRGNVIIPQDRMHVRTAGQELVEELADQDQETLQARQGAQP
jgi:hypothetical protein